MSTEDGTPNASRANNPLGWVKLFSQQEGYLTLVILLRKQVSQSFFSLHFVLNIADCASV